MSLKFNLPETIQECENGDIPPRRFCGIGDYVEYLVAGAFSSIHISDTNNPVEKEERSNKYLQNLANKKTFQNQTKQVNEICLFHLNLDDWEPLLTTLQQCGVNIKKLKLDKCHLTEKAAFVLGDVLGSPKLPPSNNKWGFYIKELNLDLRIGSTEWVCDFLEKNHQDESIPLEKISIKFDEQEQLSLRLCQAIGSFLRHNKKLKELSLRNLKSDVPSYDFLRDAIHCKKIDLSNSDFDLQTVYSLIQGNNDDTGTLKTLNLLDVKDTSKVERLLQHDLSNLDSFSISCDLSDPVFDIVCHHIAENNGTKRLGIFLIDEDLSDFAPKLASSLVGNDKIEKLDILSGGFGNDIGSQQELLNAIGRMPRLKSWSVFVCDAFDRPETILSKWKEWVPRHVESNWNIQEIKVPFDLGNDIEEMLKFNERWHKLVCCHDQMSSGIWSRALSQIETVGSMFRLIQQIPNLFQEVANAASELEKYRLPSFGVPHHVNCPGCHKRRKTATSQ